MHRRHFIRELSAGFLVLANGNLISVAHPYKLPAKKVVLRFAVASDGHYGQTGTEYEKYFSEVVSHINGHHEKDPFDFCVINGDIVHDNKSFFPAAKKALDN